MFKKYKLSPEKELVRKFNTDKQGAEWTNIVKDLVWNKGKIIQGQSKDMWRLDKCNNFIQYTEYGNRQSQFGWEIDHIIPVAHGGTDDLFNLQPLSWRNNAAKSDNLNWECSKE